MAAPDIVGPGGVELVNRPLAALVDLIEMGEGFGCRGRSESAEIGGSVRQGIGTALGEWRRPGGGLSLTNGFVIVSGMPNRENAHILSRACPASTGRRAKIMMRP